MGLGITEDILYSVFTLSQGEDSLDRAEINMIRCKSLSVTVKLYKNAFKNFFKCILTGPVSFTVTAGCIGVLVRAGPKSRHRRGDVM